MAESKTTDRARHGVITAIDLETRSEMFLRQSKIVGAMALQDGGPTRLLFDAGGHADVCGSAEIWWRVIEAARLEERDAG